MILSGEDAETFRQACKENPYMARLVVEELQPDMHRRRDPYNDLYYLPVRISEYITADRDGEQTGSETININPHIDYSINKQAEEMYKARERNLWR